MLTAQQKILKLQEAIALLQDADALQQTGLAEMDSDVCYEIHNAIENVMDEVCDVIRTLDETVE